MDTTMLCTFLAVARHRSFTAAAVELHLVQSTVTARVQGLERALGVRLFDRTPDGAQLTAAGVDAVPVVQDLLDAERRLRAVAEPSIVSGDVVIGAPESVCAYRLPSFIASLLDAEPGISIHLVPAGTAATFQGLIDRRLDLGIILDDRTPPRQLGATRIGSEPIDLVAASEHPVVDRELAWHDLVELPYFLLEQGCGYTDRFIDDLHRATGRTPRITRFGSIEAARACVEAGLGLSVLPRVALEATQGRHGLSRLRGPLRPDADLSVVTDGRRWQSAAATTTRRALEEAASAWNGHASATR